MECDELAAARYRKYSHEKDAKDVSPHEHLNAAMVSTKELGDELRHVMIIITGENEEGVYSGTYQCGTMSTLETVGILESAKLRILIPPE